MLSIRSKITMFIVLMQAITAAISFAAPAVTGITGTVTNGSALTIEGTGFGAKAIALPQIWEDFEYGNAGTDISTANGWMDYIQAIPSHRVQIADAQHYGQGTRSAYNSMWTDSGTAPTDAYQFPTAYKLFTPTDEVYVSLMMRWHVDTSKEGIWKWARVTPADNVYNGSPNIGVSDFPASSWTPAYQNDGTTMRQGDILAGHGPDNWFRVEYRLKLSTPAGTANGEATFAINNSIQTLSNSEIDNITRVSGNAEQLGSIILPFMWTNDFSNINAKKYVWIDDLYLDNTVARVEICDASTWTARTHCDVQVPIAWSNSAITVTLNKGSLNSFSAYLYVIDTMGNMNTNGYLLCPSCPRPPVLTVVN